MLWDIAQYEDRIANPRGDHRDKDLFIVCLKLKLKLKNFLHYKKRCRRMIFLKASPTIFKSLF